jgi:DNA-binding MarR family transcriptional regulator
MRTFSSGSVLPELTRDLAVLQSATRVLTGVALRSLEALDGAVTLPQFRMLAVLADLGQARSAQVARALGLEASTVTRLADRMVAAGHVVRGTDPSHRGVVTLELAATGRQLVDRVEARRREELARILRQLPAGQQDQVTAALRLLVEAAGDGYGTVPAVAVPTGLAADAVGDGARSRVPSAPLARDFRSPLAGWRPAYRQARPGGRTRFGSHVGREPPEQALELGDLLV